MSLHLIWRQPPEQEAPVLAEATRVFVEPAAPRRDMVLAALDQLSAGTWQAHHQVDETEVSALSALLIDAGVLYVMDSPMIPHPELFGLDRWPAPDDPDPAAARYRSARDHARAARLDRPGIPAHKLTSSGGWIATAGECLSSSEQWVNNVERVRDRAGTVRADRLMGWIQAAADRDGFIVI